MIRIHAPKIFQVRELISSLFSPAQFVKATGRAYILDNVQSLIQTSRPLTIDHSPGAGCRGSGSGSVSGCPGAGCRGSGSGSGQALDTRPQDLHPARMRMRMRMRMGGGV